MGNEKGQEPKTPSKRKMNDRRVTQAQVGVEQPTDRDEGWDVSKFRQIIFSMHPVDPDIDDVGAVGWIAYVKVWRFKLANRWGTGSSGGQWYAEDELIISMDGDVANGGPMEYQLPTWNAEKMFFQVVLSEGGPDTWQAAQTISGLVPQSCECEADVGSIGGGGGSGGIVVSNLFDLMAHNDYTYSSLRGDFVATRIAANSILVSGLDFAVEERQILAIGLKRSGTTSRTRMWYRDDTLRVDYTPGTSLIVHAGFTSDALDEVIVFLEGPSKVDDPTNRARRNKTVNPDPKHVATDGIFLDITKAEQADDDYFPFMMNQDGYHWLSTMITLTEDTVVTLEATNDLAADGAEEWYDVTEEVLGVASVTTANDDQAFPPQCWVGWRRMRWVVGETGSGGTCKLYMLRSAYGNHWVPVAREGLPALHGGLPVMGEARAVQAPAIAALSAGKFVTNLFKELVGAAFDWAVGADRGEEVDPVDTRDYTNVMAEVTGQGDGDFYYYLDMAHFTKVGIQIENVDGIAGDNTYTIHGSEQDDGTAPNAVIYQDITQFGCDNMRAANAANYTADVLLQLNAAGLSYKWIMVHVERANDGANTDGEWTILARPLYH